MSRRRKLVVLIPAAVVGFVAYVACRFVHTLPHILEAYAAWDSGT